LLRFEKSGDKYFHLNVCGIKSKLLSPDFSNLIENYERLSAISIGYCWFMKNCGFSFSLGPAIFTFS
jgi:type II secretory pathway component PulL